MDALTHSDDWTLLITNGAYEIARIPLPAFLAKYNEKLLQIDVNEPELRQAFNAPVDLVKEILAKLDDLRTAFETHKAECTGHEKPLICASVNCDREGRLENAVQGRLQLNSEGRALWVDVYLCDECMRFVREGKEAGISVHDRGIIARDEIAYSLGCPCLKCTARRLGLPYGGME